MTIATSTSPLATAERSGFFARTEAWLDARGKFVWIAALVLSFILFWPIGLALLAYMIWGKRMFSSNCSQSRRHIRHSSGNSAFDAYKAETLQRLEDEQANFEAFLKRLRDAKDKAEFDQFMHDRAQKNDAERDTGGAKAEA